MYQAVFQFLSSLPGVDRYFIYFYRNMNTNNTCNYVTWYNLDITVAIRPTLLMKKSQAMKNFMYDDSFYETSIT